MASLASATWVPGIRPHKAGNEFGLPDTGCSLNFLKGGLPGIRPPRPVTSSGFLIQGVV